MEILLLLLGHMWSITSQVLRETWIIKQEQGTSESHPGGLAGRPITCADEAGEASVDNLVVVGQYERTPRLHLQTVLLARNCLSAVKLCDFKILGAEPGFVDNLKFKKQERKRGIKIV